MEDTHPKPTVESLSGSSLTNTQIGIVWSVPSEVLILGLDPGVCGGLCFEIRRLTQLVLDSSSQRGDPTEMGGQPDRL